MMTLSKPMATTTPCKNSATHSACNKLGLEFLLEAANEYDSSNACHKKRKRTADPWCCCSEKTIPPQKQVPTTKPPESVWEHLLEYGRLPRNSGLDAHTISPSTSSSSCSQQANRSNEVDAFVVDKEQPPKKGRWTLKEEEYAEFLISGYRKGSIQLPPSVSLRKFLAESLNCDPMRISKKFPCLKAYKVNSSSVVPLFVSTEEHQKRTFEPRTPTSTTSSSSSSSSSGSSNAFSLTHIMNTEEEEYACSDDEETLESNESSSLYVRRGRWTPEEEAYADGMIQAFKAGQLPLPGSTSMRKFLAEILQCHPMRISKKFVGCVRKYHYYHDKAQLEGENVKPIATIKQLISLERTFWESLKNEVPPHDATATTIENTTGSDKKRKTSCE